MSLTMNYKLLVIDPDTYVTDAIVEFLSPEGFDVTCVYDGEKGIKEALHKNYDIILLDIIVPIRNGFDILKSVREHSQVPMIILTSPGDDINPVLSFEIGADDYVLKPCSPADLLARIYAVLRRSQKTPLYRPNITERHVTIDCAKRSAQLHGTLLELTNTEFNILEMLMKSPNQAFSKEELTEYALGRKFTAYDRSIDVHISNLRNKLQDTNEDNPIIKTVRGFGYLFNA